jgi:hypothetical protein
VPNKSKQQKTENGHAAGDEAVPSHDDANSQNTEPGAVDSAANAAEDQSNDVTSNRVLAANEESAVGSVGGGAADSEQQVAGSRTENSASNYEDEEDEDDVVEEEDEEDEDDEDDEDDEGEDDGEDAQDADE